MAESARVDAWLWGIRQFKTRSLATAACRAGHVRINGVPAKAAQTVRVGDEVRVRSHGFDRIVEVRQILLKRVGADAAASAYIDRTPPPPPRELTGIAPVRERGAGRPTKRERRDLDRLRGR